MGEFIPSLMKEIQKSQAPWRDEVESRWPVLVGSKYAAHAQAGDFIASSRTLVVMVDHPILAFEASRELRNLPERIREAVPAAPIQRVHFRYAPPENRA